ncbi:protein BCAP isoform X2 [Ambystoma mexicanum]|uniref:protein BCAP isoform X2 n=1 Tax=Ambystoma mexicanum TaxID=8296 RepID=UPI0037E99492
MLLAKIYEAERATNAAEILSLAIKDAVVEMPVSNMEETIKYVEVLLDMVLEDESENAKLIQALQEKEMKMQEASLHIQKEKDNAVAASRRSKFVEETHSHLQRQIEKKDGENYNMTTKIMNLKAKLSGQKLEIKDLKRKIVAVKKKSSNETEALKNSIKVLRKRAHHLEAAKGMVTSQIREKDVHLSEVLSANNVWKSHYELAVEERTALEIKVEALNQQIADTLTCMQKSRDYSLKSKEELLRKWQDVNSENEYLNQENGRLKASIDKMEDDISSVESECTDLQEKLKQEKSFVEQYETQFHKIQTETEKLKCRFEKVLNENMQISENKDLGTEKILGQMDAHLKELEHIPGLLEAADQSLQECEESLLISKQKYAGQSDTLAQLSNQVNTNSFLLENQTLEMENSRIQKKLVDLNQKVEQMFAHNQQLKTNLAHQEESLRSSSLQLEEKSKECCGLIRLLENAVEDGRKQVSSEKEKNAAREQAINKRLADLETELRKRKEEKKQIACTLSISEKHYELRLKGLKHLLEQTESKNQNIQNYVQLLKSSYAAMFG